MTAFPPVPRWARIAAHITAVTPLPSGVWRLCLAFGFSGGYTAEGLAALSLSAWGTAWLVFLSVSTELAALLTLGLVQPWGETAPRWIPFIGGKTLNPKVVTTVALTGALILFVLWTPFVFWWSFPHDDMTATGSDIVGGLYLPMVAWAPLLLAVTVDYYRRHQRCVSGGADFDEAIEKTSSASGCSSS